MVRVGSTLIVIVTLNSAHPNQARLDSVSDSDWERIVVDNASSAATLEHVRALARARVWANAKNPGFAAAGARRCGAGADVPAIRRCVFQGVPSGRGTLE